MKSLEQNSSQGIKSSWPVASSIFLLDFCTIESSGKLNLFHLVGTVFFWVSKILWKSGGGKRKRKEKKHGNKGYKTLQNHCRVDCQMLGLLQWQIWTYEFWYSCCAVQQVIEYTKTYMGGFHFGRGRKC